MSGNPFDIIIIVILIYAIFMLATGRGDDLFSRFSSRRQSDPGKTYDKEKMYRASLIFCIVLLGSELLLVFLGRRGRIFAIVSLAISIISLILYLLYMQKIRKK